MHRAPKAPGPTLQRIPRLRGAPLLGNVLELRRDAVGMLERLGAECGPVGSFTLGPRRVVVTTEPDHARLILRDRARDFEKGPVVRRFARAILGEGLIPARNAVHRRHRRFMAAAFHPRQIERYAAAVPGDVADMVAGWRDGEEIDLGEEMMRLTLRVVGKALFSRDLLGAADALGADLTTALRWVTGMIQRPWMPAVPLRPSVRGAMARLDAAIAALISERRDMGPHGAPADLLAKLVFAQDDDAGVMSDRQVRDEVMNLLVAGYETTSNALTWTWHLLMQHPEVYEQLLAYVDSTLGGRTPAAADLSALGPVQGAFEEAMRLYPPVHSLGREAQREVPMGPYTLRRGEIVIISTYLMHRREDLFEDARAFLPARFLPPRREQLPAFAYLPFGAGPRVCIGAGFAMMESVLVLAAIGQRVRFEPVPGPPVEPQMLVTLRPRHGLRARVRLR